MMAQHLVSSEKDAQYNEMMGNATLFSKYRCTGEMKFHHCSGEIISPVFHRSTGYEFPTLVRAAWAKGLGRPR